MIYGGEAWSILGIEPTKERRAIRKAYAARLKAIDPDSDIAGFQRLRQALETAEWQAKHGAIDLGVNRLAPGVQAAAAKPRKRRAKPAESSEEDAQDQGEEAAAPAPRLNVTIRLDPLPPPDPPPPPDPMIALRSRFQSLLRKRQRNEQEEAELLAAFDGLLADERMEEIDFADQMENWLAGLLNSSDRRADAVVPLAVERFGWHRELDAINPRYAQAEVARRAQDLRCIAALSEPGHQWHDAYAVLTGNAPQELDRAEKARLTPQIQDLLESLNWHNPGVYETLNRAQLHEWQTHFASRNENRDVLFKSTGISWWTVMMAIWLVMAVLRFATQAPLPEPTPRDPAAWAPEVQTSGIPALPAEMAAPGPAPIAVPGPLPLGAEKREALVREMAECLQPNAPPLSSSGQLDCAAIRESMKRSQ